MATGDKKLDNPVWHSLSETHESLSIDYGNIKFYQPDYCHFGGFIQTENIAGSVSDYSTKVDSFFIVGEKPTFPNTIRLKNELICNQMIIDDKIEMEIKENIVQLGAEYANDLFQLVNLVQPGYFKQKTFLLGNYYGIFKGEELIAVTGERMKMNQYTEVSAVVTHPDHTGKGYAMQLVAHTVNNIFNEGKMPYLHVAETNTGAIRLYEKLGFRTRRKISFWNLEK